MRSRVEALAALSYSLPSAVSPRGEAEEIGLLDPEVLDRGGDIVRLLLVARRAIDVGRVPVPLQLGGDAPPGPGEGRKELPVDRVDRVCAAVQQEQRT